MPECSHSGIHLLGRHFHVLGNLFSTYGVFDGSWKRKGWSPLKNIELRK